MKKIYLAVTVIITASVFFSCSQDTMTITESETVTPPPAITVPETSPVGGTTTQAPAAPPVILGHPGMTLPTGPVKVYSVQTDLVPSRLAYMPGEEVNMQLVLTNASQGDVEPVVVSSLPPEVNIYPVGSSPAPGPGLPMQSMQSIPTVKTFPGGSGEATLATGEKLTYDLTWDQKDAYGNQVPPGWYYYRYTCWFRPESSAQPSGSGGNGRAFLIQYPQGAMKGTIEVNQSKTITGLPLITVTGETKTVDVTVTLERVVFDDMGVTFYARMTSPDNPVTGYDGTDWVGHIPMTSQYIVDGVTKEARAPSSQFTDSGVEFRWGASADDPNYLDPVPSDAKQLTFVIPEIGHGWPGPWEFEIPLD
jgi:hypothetical protein